MSRRHLRAGNFRHYVTFQKPAHKTDTHGSPYLDWNDITEFQDWVRLAAIRGREYFEAQQAGSRVVGRIELRYRSDITPDMRVVINGSLHGLDAVYDPEGRRKELHILYYNLGDYVYRIKIAKAMARGLGVSWHGG